MALIKYQHFFTFVALLIGIATYSLHADNVGLEDPGITEQDIDDYAWDEDDNKDTRNVGYEWTDDYDDDNPPFPQFPPDTQPIRVDLSFPDQIVPALNQCKMIDVFKQDLYRRTHPLNERNIIDDPSFYTPLFDQNTVTFKGHAFYNQTSKHFFTPTEDGIGSYLALDNSPLTNALQNAFDTIVSYDACRRFFIDLIGIDEKYFHFNIKETLSLFKDIHVEERRVGTMLELFAPFNDYNFFYQLFFNIKIPFLYRERNFNISNADQQNIKARFAQLFPEVAHQQNPSKHDVMDDPLVREYLVRDTIGFGDTRLTIGYKAEENDTYQLIIGPEITIPTAFAFQNGLLSSSQGKTPSESCKFNYRDFMNDPINLSLPKAERNKRFITEVKNMGLSTIDHLSHILLDTHLGNGGHWGFGSFIEPTVRVSDTLLLHTKATIEFLLPNMQDRYFLKKVDVSEFDKRDFDSTEDEIAADNLNFLNQRLFDLLFPQRFNVRVLPGPLFKFISILKHESNSWNYSVGLDYWAQGTESLQFTDVESDIIQDYHIEKGRQPSAQQLKMFCGFAYNTEFEETDWQFFMNGGTTVLSSGIGKDFTIAAGCSVKW